MARKRMTKNTRTRVMGSTLYTSNIRESELKTSKSIAEEKRAKQKVKFDGKWEAIKKEMSNLNS